MSTGIDSQGTRKVKSMQPTQDPKLDIANETTSEQLPYTSAINVGQIKQELDLDDDAMEQLRRRICDDMDDHGLLGTMSFISKETPEYATVTKIVQSAMKAFKQELPRDLEHDRIEALFLAVAIYQNKRSKNEKSRSKARIAQKKKKEEEEEKAAAKATESARGDILVGSVLELRDPVPMEAIGNVPISKEPANVLEMLKLDSDEVDLQFRLMEIVERKKIKMRELNREERLRLDTLRYTRGKELEDSEAGYGYTWTNEYFEGTMDSEGGPTDFEPIQGKMMGEH